MSISHVTSGPASSAAQNLLIDQVNQNTTDIASASKLVLLKSNSGTTTTSSAENVDTYAMASGLTAKDRLFVDVTVESVSQATTKPVLYNSTDGVEICRLAFDGGAGDISAGAGKMGFLTIRQFQSSALKVGAVATMYTDASPGSRQDGSNTSTFTTAWTGAWTLALRHGGVTAGGTFKWSWSVYKMAGQ